MSINTWKAEFYPVSVEELYHDDPCNDLKDIDHCIQKWEGLTPDNLKKHRVKPVSGYLLPERFKLQGTLRQAGDVLIDYEYFWPVKSTKSFFEVCDETCILCYKNPVCYTCSLSKCREGHACGDKKPGESISPWFAWEERCDPAPMIKWLKKTRRMIVKNLKKD